jgi:hypothetical protein
METEGFSKTLVTTYMTTQCGKPEGHNLNSALFTVSLSIALAFCDCFSLACPQQTELKYSSLLVVHTLLADINPTPMVRPVVLIIVRLHAPSHGMNSETVFCSFGQNHTDVQVWLRDAHRGNAGQFAAWLYVEQIIW